MFLDDTKLWYYDHKTFERDCLAHAIPLLYSRIHNFRVCPICAHPYKEYCSAHQNVTNVDQTVAAGMFVSDHALSYMTVYNTSKEICDLLDFPKCGKDLREKI